MTVKPITQAAEEGWLDYNPDWFSASWEEAEQVLFHLEDLEQTFIDAFILGAMFFITKEQA